MGRKPKQSRHPKSEHVVTIKVTGAQKNLLIKAAEEAGMSLSGFMNYTIWEFCQSEKSIPPAPAPNPKPTPADYLRSYLDGTKILMPCGKEECNMQIVTFDKAEYCNTCSFRVG